MSAIRTSVIVSLLCLVVIALATFKMERIGEVCALTGACRTYDRYFSFFQTGVKVEESWVDQVLREHGKPPVKHQWRRTQGDTSTLLFRHGSHGRAPLAYCVRFIDLGNLKRSFPDDGLLALARDFASGVPGRQENALERISNR